jgi:flagellar hook protein FlgE
MSLFTTISGITNSQAMLDVIGDNIANINTIGFKASKINFETVFSNTLSAGAAPSAISGGINPKQLGLGVTVSEISRNFTRGAVQSTGRASDLNIQGEGFFTFRDTDGSMVLSRAGNFSVDSEGNLVNPRGLKALGTASVTSDASGTTTVQIPTALVLDETNLISNGTANVTAGNFTMTVNGTAHTIAVTETDTVQTIANKMNGVLTNSSAAVNASGQMVLSGTDAVSFAVGTSNFPTIAGFSTASYTSAALAGVPAAGDFTISVNGTPPQTITIPGASTYAAVAAQIDALLPNSTVAINGAGQMVITGSDSVTFAVGTSTFPTTAAFTHNTYSSSALTDDPQIAISAGDVTNAHNYKATSYSITNDGAIEVTYSNGARLTVTTLTGQDSRTLKYITSGSQEITGVTTAAVDPAQLQIQLAQVINPKGLSSVGGNLYSMNSVAGTPSFAIGRAGGMGSIDSGSLEASNVDLPTEFANMILAQKAVEANSRAFSVQNQIMDVIVNLGR